MPVYSWSSGFIFPKLINIKLIIKKMGHIYDPAIKFYDIKGIFIFKI